MYRIVINSLVHYVSREEAAALRSLGLVTTGSYSQSWLSLTSPEAAADVLALLDVDEPLTDAERLAARRVA